MSIFQRRGNPAPMVLFLAFCDRFNIPLFDWQREAFGGATERQGDRFLHPLAGVSMPRGDGKSFGSAAVGIWRLVTSSTKCRILTAALDLGGTRRAPRSLRSVCAVGPLVQQLSRSPLSQVPDGRP
jgi:hypothetical protein